MAAKKKLEEVPASEVEKDVKDEGVEPEVAPAPKPARQTVDKAMMLRRQRSQEVLEATRKTLAKYAPDLKPVVINFKQKPHIPSGSIIIDHLIGGSATDGDKPICPGYPRRKITEIYGPESSGKTTIALTAIVNVQREGGSAIFLDFEHALDHRYARAIGVDFNRLLYVAPATLEDGFKAIVSGLVNGADLIVVDSVAAMVPEAEVKKKITDVAKIGVLAAKMSQNLPKITNWLATLPKDDPGHPGTALILLNQERALISTGGHGGESTTTTGGKALKFYASLRLRFSRYATEKIERVDRMTGKKKQFAYGNTTLAKVVKNKMDGSQGHEGLFLIRYGFGVDDVLSVIESGAANGIIKKAGATYTYKNERFIGRDKMRSFLIGNPRIYQEIRAAVGDAIVQRAIPDTEVEEDDSIAEDVFKDFEDGDTSEDNPEEATVEDADFAEPSDSEDPAV